MNNTQILDFHIKLQPPKLSDPAISWIEPFKNKETIGLLEAFSNKYYTSNNKRRIWFGINPGRHGAGVTGVAFNDPKILADKHGISNSFPKRTELSTTFIDEFIYTNGAYEDFYKHNYITSVCPLGLLKNDKNYNYYDDAQTLADAKDFIVQTITEQVSWGVDKTMGISIGKGKNFKILKDLNNEYNWFDTVIAVPHPRWVLQYKRKDKILHIDTYLKYVYDGS